MVRTVPTRLSARAPTLLLAACIALATGSADAADAEAPARFVNTLGMPFVRIWPLYTRCAYRNVNTASTRYTLVGIRLLREDGPP